MTDEHVQYPLVVFQRAAPWNKGRIVGQKAPFKLKELCAIRAWLDYEHNIRDRALLDIAVDSKMRGGDVTRLRVNDVCHGDQILLGHTKIENTVRYLGVELDEALTLSEQVEV
jgi:hypothetical protein